jgi:hypothetical protein
MAAPKLNRYLRLQVFIFMPNHAQLTLNGNERMQELSRLEKMAQTEGYPSLSDTITLELANESESASEKIRHLDKVLAKKSRGYNEARAIVAKASAVEKMDKTAGLDVSDLLALSAAYSYLHAQRFSNLFDPCHDALWKVFEARSDTTKLLRLFRHSSFVWRIRGEEAKEAEYLKRLDENRVRAEDVSASTFIVIEVSYFLRRLKVMVPVR